MLMLTASAVMAIDDGSKPMTPRERALAVRKNTAALYNALRGDKWNKAKDLCRRLIELQPRSANHRYNLACCHAQLKDPNAALDSLAKAVELGYDNVDHMKADKDLASLRKTGRWKKLLEEAGQGLKRSVRKTDDEWVVTGKPGGGLHYRLRLSRKASKKRPHRLVIWLHPSGGSGNAAAEKLTDVLHENGYSLLVFTKKNFRGWSEASFNRAVRTGSALKDVKGLDANRPILMGYSAGGQMALSAWVQKPGYFGGLILDAAYPLDTVAYSRGQLKPLKAPRKRKQVKACPIFVLVGDQDGGAKLWKKVESDWRKAGVPLEVHYVKGGRHQWLFGVEQVKLLDKWLSKARKVQAPTTQPSEDGSNEGESKDSTDKEKPEAEADE
jgi:predicted esterase